MKLLKLKVDGLANYKDTLEIDFYAEQRVAPDSTDMLSHLFSNKTTNIYTNNIISFIGINASGKTSVLKFITFALKMLNCEPINYVSRAYDGILDDSTKVSIESYFYDENFGICKLYTLLEKKEALIETYVDEIHFSITEEVLWVKPINKVSSKKALFHFTDTDIYKKRDNQETFLKDDISIVMVLNKSNNFFVQDLLGATDINHLYTAGFFPNSLVKFLDGSIEYIKCDPYNKWAKLKFYDREEIQASNVRELEKYLSSGTIKGLNVFVLAQMAFQEGGYFIIDELENHFNQEVVSTLLRFFSSSRVNPKGATLIFSTHYSELLDELDRNDCVNIVRNRGGITSEKLSYILKRNDIKKSEAYQSDFLQGTVPAYDAYIELKELLLNSFVQEVTREEVVTDD